eukprot:UN03479
MTIITTRAVRLIKMVSRVQRVVKMILRLKVAKMQRTNHKITKRVGRMLQFNNSNNNNNQRLLPQNQQQKAKPATNNKFAGFFDDDDEEDEEEAAAAEEVEEEEEETDPLASLGRIQTDAPSNNASVDPLAASIAEVRSFDREQLESIERKILNSWQDYDYSEDPEDVEYAFKDVKEDDRYLIAYQFFAGVADRKKADIDELIKNSVVYQYFPLTTEQWERGFRSE